MKSWIFALVLASWLILQQVQSSDQERLEMAKHRMNVRRVAGHDWTNKSDGS